MNRLPSYGKLPTGFRLNDRFVIVKLIGAGASSFVYLATDQTTGAEVALKLLNPFLQRDRVTVTRFRREIEICHAIHHPQIVKLFDFCEQDDFTYLVMEYVEGRSLTQWINEQGIVAVKTFLEMAQQIVSVMIHCHDAGVIHRDLKPQNLILTPSGLVRIVDFGVAKLNTMSDLTKTGTSIGTPQYMAPELFWGERPDPRCDIYSLGVVFFELLTGTIPYPVETVLSLKTGDCPVPSARAFNPEVPVWLDQVLTTMLQKEPNRRYHGMREIAFDLEQGEESLRSIRLDQASGKCLFCHEDLIAGLPFCGYCGTSFLEAGGRGRHALILYATSHPEGIAAHLSRLLPAVTPKTVLRRLKNPPCIIVKQINEKAASLLFNDLNLFPATLEMVNSLPRQFALPRLGSGITFALTVPFAMVAGSIWPSRWTAVGLVLCLWTGLALWFLRLTMPLIPRRLIRSGGQAIWSTDRLLSYQRRIKSIQDREHKEVVATLLARSLQVARGSDEVKQKGSDPVSFDFSPAVEAAFGLVYRLEEMKRFLVSTSLSALQEKIMVIDVHLASDGDQSRFTELIERKVLLVEEQKSYAAVSDQFARCYQQLLRLSSIFNLLATKLSLGRLDDVRSDMDGLTSLTQTLTIEKTESKTLLT